MIKFFRADLRRLWKSPAFWLSLGGMLLICAGLMFMQATAMEYTVPLSRVIFLPLSLYGIGTASFVSFFVGEEFGGGFIRNKLLVARCRGDCLLSMIAVSCVGCILIYVVMTAFTGGVGAFFFENNVESSMLLCYFFLGLGTSVTLSCLFAVITLLCGNQAKGVLWCMALAFGMLFLCLHTNSVLVQPEYKDGILNSHYVGGIRRMIYALLHDLNPYGQAAQLSSWEVFSPLHCVLCDFVLVSVTTLIGWKKFSHQNVM